MTVLSVSFIILGISSVIVTIIEGNDKTYIGKYDKIKFFIDLVAGFTYTILGLLVILKVISQIYLVCIAVLFVALKSLINYKIKANVNN